MWTDATLWMLMLISSTLNQERLRRITAFPVTSMRVAKSKLPFVHRLAWNISDAIISFFFLVDFGGTSNPICGIIYGDYLLAAGGVKGLYPV